MSNQIQITGGAKVRSLEGVLTGTSGVLSSVPLGAANGVATLDSGGKVPVSQLPSSVVTYLGTWNAATNTPTLTNGVGDAGDMYICNVAGTVNFGAGPVTFAVGDWVLYGSGTWQKSSGQNGTVTSVAASITGNAIGLTGSPITTAGTLAFAFAGTSGQYVNGAGNLTTFPTLITSIGLSMPSAFSVANSPLTANGTISVTGAGTSAQYIDGTGSLQTFPSIISQAQNLVTEVYNESGATLTKGTVVYINGGHGNLPTITKALATSDATSAQTYGVVQSDITNNNNGYVVVIGLLSNIDTQAYAAGTQLYLSSTTAGAWTSTKQYAPAHLVYVGIVVRSHPTQGVVEVKIQNGYEMDELHNVSAQSPSNGNILQYVTSTGLWTAVAGTTTNIAEGTNLYYTDARARGALSFTAGSGAYNSTTGVITIPTNNNQITNGAGYITLTSLSATSPLSYNNTTGAFSIQVANTSQSGYLSSTDWNTFNSKQSALTFSSPLVNTSGTVSIPAATSSVNGYLTSTDWSTFNGKQAALSGTGIVKSTAGTISYLTDNSTNWNTAYNDSIVSAAVTGTTTKTLTLTQQDAGTITASWTDYDTAPVTSVFGRTGAVVATEGDYTLTQLGDVTITSPTTGQVLKYNGTTWINDTDANTGTVTSVGLSAPTGFSVTGSPVTSSGTLALAFATGYSLPTTASQSNWDTAYTNRITSATSPLSITSNVISISQATTSTSGYLSSTDWNTFNNKQGTITLTTTGTSGAATFVGNTLNIPNYGSALSGYLPLTGGTLTGALGGTSASFSSTLTTGGTIQITGAGSPTTGAGLEMGYGNFTAGRTTITSYNRTGAAYVGNDYNALDYIWYTSGSQKMTLTNSGNLGLGVTPSAWSNSGNLDLNDVYISLSSQGAYGGTINNNAYYNAGWKYKGANYATQYQTLAGEHRWLTAGVGAGAGNAISFTQAMTLFSDGNLLLTSGTVSNAGYKLDVNGTGRFTGNLGVATAPYGWVTLKGLDVGSDAALADYPTYYTMLTNNTYYNGSNFIFKNNGYAGWVQLRTDDGTIHIATTTSSGTAGTTVSTMTDRLSFSNTGAATFSSSVTATSTTATGAAMEIQGSVNAVKTLYINRYGVASGSQHRLRAENAYFEIASANSEPIVLTGGNVGIGTTSPSSLLTVAGATDLAWSASTSKLQILRSGSQARINNYQSGSGSSIAIGWDGGNVLIGTTTDDSSKLQVNGTYGNLTANFIGVTTTSGSFGIGIAAGTNTSDYAMYISNAAANTQYFKVTGDGKTIVGNGTNDGVGTLQVKGAATFSSTIKTGATSYGAGAVKFGIRNAGSATGAGGYMAIEIDGTTYFLNLFTSTP